MSVSWVGQFIPRPSVSFGLGICVYHISNHFIRYKGHEQNIPHGNEPITRRKNVYRQCNLSVVRARVGKGTDMINDLMRSTTIILQDIKVIGTSCYGDFLCDGLYFEDSCQQSLPIFLVYRSGSGGRGLQGPHSGPWSYIIDPLLLICFSSLGRFVGWDKIYVPKAQSNTHPGYPWVLRRGIWGWWAIWNEIAIDKG